MGATKPARAVGWYALPKSGTPYYGTLPDGVTAIDGPPAVDGVTPPAASASKSAWVEFAISQGWSLEDAQRKTRDALAAELGQQDVDSGEGHSPVGPEVPGGDLGTDPVEVLDSPVGIDGDGQDLDVDIVGHENEA